MNDWLELQRMGIANSQANAQKKQTDELLKAQNQTNKLLEEAARAERERPQCPHCGGKLNGKFDICEHCGRELHWGRSKNPFKTSIEAQQNILEVKRKEVERQKEVERRNEVEDQREFEQEVERLIKEEKRQKEFVAMWGGIWHHIWRFVIFFIVLMVFTGIALVLIQLIVPM